MSVTIHVRSVAWFAGGAIVAMVVMLMFLDAWRVDAAPGDLDSTLVPITPCRLVDTRFPGEPPLGPGVARTFEAHGTNGNVPGSQCTIPSDAVGLSMNVTALDASVGTFWTIWPQGVSKPNASSLNPAPGQPPTPNAVTTPISSAGKFKVFNAAGSVGMLIDVNGCYTQSSLTDLAQKVSTLETKLASMSATTVDGNPTVLFTGVNVQVVDGTDDSQCSAFGFENCNGVGNLIVGYSEAVICCPEDRSGSHNIVVGNNHSWTSHSGIVVGNNNLISGQWATVLGGVSNSATGLYSSVSGGNSNRATGNFSAVSGGLSNQATGQWASVSGGWNNTAAGTDASSVLGGAFNVADGDYSSVSGGDANVASGNRSSVLGGFENVANADHSSVSGGGSNTASGERSSVSGGLENTASGPRASVSGGKENQATDNQAWASGGFRNTADGVGASALGGSDNTAGPTFNDVTVVGGIGKVCNSSTAQLC